MKSNINFVLKFLIGAFILTASVSCKKEAASATPILKGVDYEFTIVYDGYTYKVKGNSAKDEGFRGPIVNECIASDAKFVQLSIKDVTFHNFITGRPMTCLMGVAGNFVKGTNMLTVDLSFVRFYKNQNACPGCNGGGNNQLPFNITDLGTPSTGSIGTPNFVFGNTIKGKYSGTVYTVPAGSNNATVPHSLSIDFVCVRQY